MFFNEPYGRDPDAVGRRNLTQLVAVLRGRDEDGKLKVQTVPEEKGDEPASEWEAYREHLVAVGLTDPKRQAKAWKAEQARRAAFAAANPVEDCPDE